LNREGPCFGQINKVFGSHEPRHLAVQLTILERSGFVEQDRFTQKFRPLMLFMEDKMIDLPLDETEVLSVMSQICLTQADMPTEQALADYIGIELAEIAKIIKSLQARGLIKQDSAVQRSFSIVTEFAYPNR